MESLEERGICLFCPDHLSSDPGHTVYRRSDWWTVTNNRFPYEGAALHLLVIPSVHAADIMDLPAEARAEFWPTLEWVRGKWRLGFYGVAVRCGDFRFTGGSLEHVHFHVVVGDVADPEHEPVRMKLSSRADDAQVGYSPVYGSNGAARLPRHQRGEG